MSEQSEGGDTRSLVVGLHTLIDDFDPTVLTSGTSDDLLEFWRELERLRNRLASIEHHVIAEVAERNIAVESGARDLTAFTRQLLHVSAAEARARVSAAEVLVGPQFEPVAAAQASGAMSPAQARLVVSTMNRIPDELLDVDPDLQHRMVAAAATTDLDQFGRQARAIVHTYDEDAMLRELAYRDRIRDLNVHHRHDGSARIDGELTPECATRLRTVLDALDRPRPKADGVKDPRTAGQRRHDALLDILELVQRADQLPSTSGVSTTVILSITDESWFTGHGTAETAHGVLIPAGEAIRWAGGDARVATVAFNDLKAVTAYSSSHRIFTESQRLALIARDRGCTFPGCDVRPAWCQAHHVIEHNKGGPTTIDNGALLCGHHHRTFQKHGWTCRMINGRPHWTPPGRTPNRAPDCPPEPAQAA